MDKSEKRFESDIERFLISDAGGYEQFSYLNPNGHRIHKYVYDKEKALYPEVLIHFIAKSQPKAWARYQKYYGEDAPEKLYRRLENSINENGLVHVLKYGIEDMGIKLKVCYFKPESSLNEEQNELYKMNVLGCTRQFAYSPNNRNTITEMDPIRLASINGTGLNLPDNGEYMTRVQIGNPFGAIYGLRYKGVYSYNYDNFEKAEAAGATSPVARDANGGVIYGADGKPMQMYYDYNGTRYAFQGGDAIYEDINHDGSIDAYDVVYLGSSLPKLTGGFGFRLYYGRWSLNAQFNYRYGNKIVNEARMRAENMHGANNQSMAVNYRWRKEGDGADGSRVLPRALYNAGYNWLGSDRFVEDGSFLRLNYLQISYSMEPKLIKRIGLSRLSFYLSGENLFCLTKYSGVDPEVSYGSMGMVTDKATTPRAKSYTFGLTATF